MCLSIHNPRVFALTVGIAACPPPRSRAGEVSLSLNPFTITAAYAFKVGHEAEAGGTLGFQGQLGLYTVSGQTELSETFSQKTKFDISTHT